MRRRWRYYLSDLGQQRRRIALTIVGIVWGTMSVTILIAFGESASNSVRRGEAGMGKGIVVIWGGNTTRPHAGLPPGRPIQLTYEDTRLLKDVIPGIADISAEFTAYFAGILEHDGRLSNARVSGVDPSYRDLRNFFPQAGGRFINDLDMEQRRRVVFLGNALKGRVFGPRDAVGEVVRIKGVPFTVIGVMEPKLQMSSYYGQDKDWIVMPATTFQSMWGWRHIRNLVYRPVHGTDSPQTLAAVQETLARKYRFHPEDPTALSTWDTLEGEEITNRIHAGIRTFLGLVGVATLIVAGVGVANVMYVLVKNRTQEIGIKIAVGARPRDIKLFHLVEGGIIVLVGGVLGVFFSWLIIFVMNRLPIEQEALLYFGRPTLSVTTVVMVTVCLGLVALLAGYFPARRAASVDPVEALRYE